jgi:DNA-binding transcriptional regulator YbjK
VSVKKLSAKLNYLGRPAKRADSRERREAILDATLRVIERDGVRGVRHRAVAKEAEVPLAATTYYFEDIHALVHDAFVHYIDRDKGNSQKLETEGFSVLKDLTPEQLAESDTRVMVVAVLIDLLMSHLRIQIADISHRNIETAFRHEAMRDQLLAKPMLSLHEAQLASIEDFFSLLGSTTPTADAKLILASILYLENEILLYADDEARWDDAKQVITRLVTSLIGTV